MAGQGSGREWSAEQERLEIQAALYDPGTQRRIEELGLTAGWRCAEIGAGTGSIARWLGGRVGAEGRVVATDVEGPLLDRIGGPNVEVRRHDIVVERLEAESFDLVHARFLLMHLGEGRDAALSHMVEALKPGGWLLAEEPDSSTVGIAYPADEVWARVTASIAPAAQYSGTDLECGRKLPSYLESAGLADVGNEGHVTLLRQGSDAIRSMTLLYRSMRGPLVGAGLADAAELDAMIDRYERPGPRRALSPLLVAAWGRKRQGS